MAGADDITAKQAERDLALAEGDAWLVGILDARLGNTVNPFDVGSFRAKSWQRGFNAGRRTAEGHESAHS